MFVYVRIWFGKRCVRQRWDGCDTVGVYISPYVYCILARDKNSRVEMRRDACGTMMFLCLHIL